jgi:hypothetical protein
VRGCIRIVVSLESLVRIRAWVPDQVVVLLRVVEVELWDWQCRLVGLSEGADPGDVIPGLLLREQR